MILNKFYFEKSQSQIPDSENKSQIPSFNARFLTLTLNPRFWKLISNPSPDPGNPRDPGDAGIYCRPLVSGTESCGTAAPTAGNFLYSTSAMNIFSAVSVMDDVIDVESAAFDSACDVKIIVKDEIGSSCSPVNGSCAMHVHPGMHHVTISNGQAQS